MSGFLSDVPEFGALMRAEYAYNLESHHGEFFTVRVFGVDSVEGRAVGWYVLTDFGAQFARLPIAALCWKPDAPALPLDWLELWNNFSYQVQAHEFTALRGVRADVLLKDRAWYPGHYLFTLGWWGSALAEDAGDGGFKTGNVIRLENGCFAIQPNNRIRWREPSFVTKPFPERPDFKTLDRTFDCETSGEKWATEDSPAFFYRIEGGSKASGGQVAHCNGRPFDAQ